MSGVKRNPEPFEKYKKEIAQNRKIGRLAIIRGFFFLGLCAAVTYVAKFRDNSPGPVKTHGLIVWVFPGQGHLSVLILFPDDGDSANSLATGEKIWVHPAGGPEFLEANFIRYAKSDLYLLGRVSPGQVESFCESAADSSHLYFAGPGEWAGTCSRAVPLAGLSPKLTRDWSVQTDLELGADSTSFRLTLNTELQRLVFNTGTFTCELPTPAGLCVQLDSPVVPGSLPQGVVTLPGQGFWQGKPDSNFALVNPRQALGARYKENGQLEVKKIWLQRGLAN